MTNSSCGQPPEGGKSYGMIAMARCEVTGTAADRYINGTTEFRGPRTWL